MPTHYEPLESPVHNALYSRDTNPVVNWFTRQENRFAPPGDPRFPFVLTTYRLTEHHTAGGMSRFLSHLAELQPELFAEMSPELARELKIDNGDYISVVSLRGAIEARALVSRRIRPMHLNGKTVHQIAMPFHFGSAGPVKGGATNDLVPFLASDFTCFATDTNARVGEEAHLDVILHVGMFSLIRALDSFADHRESVFPCWP